MRDDATERELALGDRQTAALGRMSLEQQAVRAAEERVAPYLKEQAARIEEPPATKLSSAPPPEDPLRPISEVPGHVDPLAVASALAAGSTPSSPPPPQVRPAERPRLQAAPHKEKDAGQQAKQKSAAVGEDYLNSLLVGGLLDVPNVEARDLPAPERPRLGRSARRAFITLWVLLVLAVGGGAGWYFYTKDVREKFVAARLEAARAKITAGGLVDYADAARELEAAVKKDPTNVLVVATLAEARALNLFTFGAGEAAQVDAALSWLAPRLRDAKPDAAGRKQLAIARVARNLALLDKVQDPKAAIAEARAELDRALAAAPADGTLLWLDGALKLALGDRAGARAAFEKADAGGQGPVAARVAIGDLQLDDGDTAAALASYEQALGRSAKHPFALVGRALARLESASDAHADAEAAQKDVNVALAGVSGTRIEAWKHLALAVVYARLDDYEKAAKELEIAAASGLTEPRFVARIALERVDRGRIVEAGRTRERIRYFGDAPGRDPLIAQLDAELYLASGMPDEAIAAIGDIGSIRARVIRGRAMLDGGQAADAVRQFEAVLEIAPADPRARTWREMARVAAKQDAKAAYEALRSLARASGSGFPRYVLGEAALVLGQAADARRDLRESLKLENPFAYRARTRLAEMDLAEGAGLEDAEKGLREALEQSPLYVPAHAALGKLLLKQGKAEAAIAPLEQAAQSGRAKADVDLALAEALALAGRKDDARAALVRAKEKGASAEQVGRVAASIDPALAQELGVNAPGESAPPRDWRRRR